MSAKTLLVIGILGLFIIACTQQSAPQDSPQNNSQNESASPCCNPEYKGTGASMPNPASVYCGCIGGQLAMKEEAAGTAGYCTINGKETEEWQLFRDQCHIE